MRNQVGNRTIVLGAGVVGLAGAVELQNRGKEVCLIDPEEPGSICSYGNAGIIAASEIFPIISPSRLWGLPGMLVDRDGPVAVRLTALPRVVPWLARATETLRSHRQREITQAIVALNKQAVSAWRDLLDLCAARFLMSERGTLSLTRESDPVAVLQHNREKLNEWSISSQQLSAYQAHELEPGLNGSVTGALLHEIDAQVANPSTISEKLAARFRAKGGLIIRQRALAIDPQDRSCSVRTDSEVHQADHVIVAMGLDSSAILAPLGASVPLIAERGYHLDLRCGAGILNRPVTFLEESCVATPMAGFLRLAGTIEFAGRRASPAWGRAERLKALAQRYFEAQLPDSVSNRWMGQRPSLPDSLPAIGLLHACPSVGYVFGHQHLGLTQAAISAKVMADLVFTGRSAIDHRPYSIERFGTFRKRSS